MRPRALAALLVAAAACAVAAPASAGPIIGETPDIAGMHGYLSMCAKFQGQREWSCYLTHLRQAVLAYRDPARQLPQLDVIVERSGGFIAGNCHMLMHVVGRDYALAHHVTLQTLQHYLPLSNDPGCSAGFGMGLVMGLSKQIFDYGPHGANALCAKAPTRMRNYTCYHSLGHAYMRFFHGGLKYALGACRALGKQALDCEQGAFHDYWLARSGEDGAVLDRADPATARQLCAKQKQLVAVACWYRYYLSLPPKLKPTSPARIDALCRGLAGFQREGCIASASLISDLDPVRQFSICTGLAASDIDSCMRGVGVQNLPDPVDAGKKLIAGCASVARAARAGCYSWFGLALTVLSDGKFSCHAVAGAGARSACLAGAKREGDPLVTFA